MYGIMAVTRIMPTTLAVHVPVAALTKAMGINQVLVQHIPPYGLRTAASVLEETVGCSRASHMF
jgi:hypothetical protein